mmetsp:Transcript_9309/g.16462  ORF Transcript_9309/g.16462 Transcript_9309/m.16462 type:complete len:239 (+) Transcript_9309:574-1290(+)
MQIERSAFMDVRARMPVVSKGFREHPVFLDVFRIQISDAMLFVGACVSLTPTASSSFLVGLHHGRCRRTAIATCSKARCTHGKGRSMALGVDGAAERRCCPARDSFTCRHAREVWVVDVLRTFVQLPRLLVLAPVLKLIVHVAPDVVFPESLEVARVFALSHGPVLFDASSQLFVDLESHAILVFSKAGQLPEVWKCFIQPNFSAYSALSDASQGRGNKYSQDDTARGGAKDRRLIQL